MNVQNMTTRGGNTAPNQFIIVDDEFTVFQSYQSIIVRTSFRDGERLVELDTNMWNCSRTTRKYRNDFLGETTKETQNKINSGEYELVDLNES